MCSCVVLLKNERQNLSDNRNWPMKSVGSAYGSQNAQQQAQFERLQFKMAKRPLLDRVSRAVYVHSGFEPDKFGRTGAASLANPDFSNLKQRRYGFPRARTAEWTVHVDQVGP
jgi:hypothetical protein